jgi:peptidyl-tRNA hydrolase, PTH1 family
MGSVRRLVAGLGNPGPDYAGTRHNVGFATIERLAAEGSARFSPGGDDAETALILLGGSAVVLLKPQTFMNRSGAAVAAWLDRLALPAAGLVVVHDDLDLPLGRLRIVAAAGAGGHRGVRSIQETLGTVEFPRVRVGIGRPEAGQAAAQRVLAEFTSEERPVAATLVERAAAAVRCLILEGVDPAMNRYNVRRGPDSGSRAATEQQPEQIPTDQGR